MHSSRQMTAQRVSNAVLHTIGMAHPLDNPVWASLTSDHAVLARMAGPAARYPADVAPFVAVAVSDARAAEQAANLVDAGESVCFVGLAPPLSAAWTVEQSMPIAQMTADPVWKSSTAPRSLNCPRITSRTCWH